MFHNLLTNTPSSINLAHWVKVLLFQRKENLNFLSDSFNSQIKLLIGKLMELCQESLSCKLILSAI